MIIYLVFKAGECVYVGQTIQGLAKRKGHHFSCARKGRNGVFGAAIRKHGEEAFGFVEYMRCTSQQELDYFEKHFIALLRPRYNMQAGGKTAFEPWNKGAKEGRPEVLKRISQAAQNRKRTKRGKYKPEHVEKLRKASLRSQQKPFVCHQTGEVFMNKITCAQKLGINAKSLAVLLSMKTRLRSLKGYTFSYLTLAQDKPTLMDLEAPKQGNKAEPEMDRERLTELAEKSDVIV